MREEKVGAADEQQPTSALILFKTSPPANKEFSKPVEKKKRERQKSKLSHAEYAQPLCLVQEYDA